MKRKSFSVFLSLILFASQISVFSSCDTVKEKQKFSEYYFDYFDSTRIQILGKVEHFYMMSKTKEERKIAYDNLMQKKVPAIVITRGLDYTEEFVDAAKKYKENDKVVHAIQAHHGDVEAKTIIACLVQAADAISAARPGARRENIESYIQRLQKLEEITTSFAGVDNAFAIQAGREVRIMVKPEAVSDDQMVLLARDIVQKIEGELEYPGQIKVNVIRESRAIDFAK